MFNFFKKLTTNNFVEFLQNEEFKTHLTDSFMSLNVNKTYLQNSLLTREIVLQSQNKSYSLECAEKKTHIFFRLQKSHQLLFEGEIESSHFPQKAVNSLIDYKIENELEKFKNALVSSPLSIRAQPTEDKAVEWFKVTLETLKKAIIESYTNEDYLFQATFFMGIHPQKKCQELRIILFNLDMTFEVSPENHLRLMIYNTPLNSEQKLVLSGDYALRKCELFDMAIDLMSLLSKGIKL